MNQTFCRAITLAALLALLPGPVLAQGTYMGQAQVVRPVPPVAAPPATYGAPTYGAPSYGAPSYGAGEAPAYGAPGYGPQEAAPYGSQAGQQQGPVGSYPQEQLDALLAPVALYPDQLLAQVLMAATFPLDVVEAARFVQQNPNLNGAALDNALAGKPWDPSVLSLAAFPQVLLMMNDRLDWTRQLGDAFLADQDGVMQTVQELRQRAQAAGNLADTPQQRVIVEDRAIYIEPAQPDVVYVPAYNPTVVYGTWWAPAYVPFYWRPPAVYYPGVIGAGIIAFSIGHRVTGNHWGWARPDWRSRHIAIDFGRPNRFIERRPYYRQWVQNGWWQHRGERWRDSRGGRPAVRLPDRQAGPGNDGRWDGRNRRTEPTRGEAPPRIERQRGGGPEARVMPREEGRRGGSERIGRGNTPGPAPAAGAPAPRLEGTPGARRERPESAAPRPAMRERPAAAAPRPEPRERAEPAAAPRPAARERSEGVPPRERAGATERKPQQQ